MGYSFATAFLAVLAANALTVLAVYAVFAYRHGSPFWSAAAKLVAGVTDLGLRAYAVIVGLAVLVLIGYIATQLIAETFY